MDYNFIDICKALKKANIRKGDNVFCHTNLGFFGRLKLLVKTTLKGSGWEIPRLVNRGSSDRTVPPPTMIASHFARR